MGFRRAAAPWASVRPGVDLSAAISPEAYHRAVVERLDYVAAEAGVFCLSRSSSCPHPVSATITILYPTVHCEASGSRTCLSWEPNVEQDRRVGTTRQPQRCGSVMSDLVLFRSAKQHRERLCRVLVVINNEDRTPRRRRRLIAHDRRSFHLADESRQMHNDLAASIRPFAKRVHRTTVQLDQTLDQCQAKAETTL